MKHTKFVACLVGLIATVIVTVAGKMDANFTIALSVIVGGFYGSNTLNTRAALANGKDAHE